MVGREFAFSVIEEKPNRQKATITIGREHIQDLYNEAVLAQKKQVVTQGFTKGNTPTYYIEQNFRPNIVEHLKELLFKHCVIHCLYSSLTDKKIVIAGDPDLVDIRFEPGGDAEFDFSLINVSVEAEQRWKRLSLRRLERKHYKDLDRQVDTFIKEETERKNNVTSEEISLGDWVNFEIALYDQDSHALMRDYKSNLWVRIQEEEDDLDLQKLFVGKKIGDCFLTQSVFLQEYISFAHYMDYTFSVEIKDCLPQAYFSLDLFKHQFNITDDKQLLAKLVEVFSTRNDITLRKETIEAVFKVLSKQYFFLLPNNLLERQRQIVLQAVQHNPDYQVYKSEPDFKDKIKQLASKQLREAIIIDAIAFQEEITVSDKDVCAYLNLLKRPRTKEFMYFVVPTNKTQGQESPLSTGLIKRYALREKALNHVIRELIKKQKE